MYAIFEDGSHQFRVREGDHVHVHHRVGKAGDEVVFPSVLLIAGGPSGLAVGTPVIEGAQVVATVVNQFRTKKIIVQKFRRPKNMRRTVRITPCSSASINQVAESYHEKTRDGPFEIGVLAQLR